MQNLTITYSDTCKSTGGYLQVHKFASDISLFRSWKIQWHILNFWPIPMEILTNPFCFLTNTYSASDKCKCSLLQIHRQDQKYSDKSRCSFWQIRYSIWLDLPAGLKGLKKLWWRKALWLPYQIAKEAGVVFSVRIADFIWQNYIQHLTNINVASDKIIYRGFS